MFSKDLWFSASGISCKYNTKAHSSSVHNHMINSEMGFSPVCMIIWLFKLLRALNPLLHTEHLNGRLGSCTPSCVFKLDFALLEYGHLSQLYLKGFNSNLWCHILCFVRVNSEVNQSKQLEHLISEKRHHIVHFIDNIYTYSTH